MCVAPTVDKSPCCDNRISPPGMLHVSKKLSDQVENKCVVENPWQIDVKWNLTKNGKFKPFSDLNSFFINIGFTL
jgi:hypothetical protein